MTTTLLHGDCRHILPTLPDKSVRCVVTSPPYFGLRSYLPEGHPDKIYEIGLEPTPAAYVDALVSVFREVWRVLSDDGTLWLNLGDSYASDTKWGGKTSGKHAGKLHGDTGIGRRRTNTGLPPKSLIGIPWRVAFGLQDDGWTLRSEIIWNKPNAMPESVTDRPTRSHETIFLFSKGERYYCNMDAIKEPAVNGDPRSPKGSRGVGGHLNSGNRKQDQIGKDRYTNFNDRYQPVEWRNKRSVWTINTCPIPDAHFATFPEALVEPCILAGSAPGDTVMDCFGGSGTVGRVAERLQRDSILIELNPNYIILQERRTDGVQLEVFV